MFRRASKSCGSWLLVALAASCGGKAFEVGDEDVSQAGSGGGGGRAGGSGSSSGSGSPSTSGRAPGGGDSPSAGSPSAGRPPSEGGAGAGAGGGGPVQAGASPSGGEAGSGSDPTEPEPISKEQLVYWFKADTGITEASSGRIVQWDDQSGNAQHARQGLAAQRPKLTKTELFPYPVVELDGARYLELPEIDAPIDAGLTFFAVAGRSEESECGAIIELSNGLEEDDVFFGHAKLSLQYEVGASWYVSQGAVFDLGAMRQVTLVQTPDDTTARVEMRGNGALLGSGEVPLPPRLLRTQNFIGLTQYVGCSPFIGAIAEIVLYSRVLPRAEQRAVEKYLHDKWQLPD